MHITKAEARFIIRALDEQARQLRDIEPERSEALGRIADSMSLSTYPYEIVVGTEAEVKP